MSAPTITLTGVFGLDALSLYKTEKRFSSMAGNISSAKYMNFSRYYRGAFDPNIINIKV